MQSRRRFFLAAVLPALLLCTAPVAATQSDTLRIAGLSAPVEILRDPWGISHIYAQSERDLFFAQGFNVARDRLFQLEMWRRQATGTVAEILGPRAVQRDRGARLLRYRGDLRRELNHYHPRGEAIIGAFVQGINAYVALTEQNPDLLPIEFRMLGIRPGRWTPEVVISRHNGLYRNAGSEIRMARMVERLGADLVKELLLLEPGDPDLTLPEGLNVSLMPDEILELYNAARAPLDFQREDLAAAYRGEGSSLAQLAGALPAPPRVEEYAIQDVGSNNWVVSGARTLSGRAIMANDPHRSIQLPSLRYWVHLVAPGWNVIGGGEPSLPGVSIGHNEHGAWGLTIFSVDQEDLYIYETDPANPARYRYRGRWEEMRVVRDTIHVKGEAPVAVELRFTRHGPVLHEDPQNRRAYALRAAWLEVGSAPYLASLRMNQARSWEEFREACSYSRTPAENMVWADVRGNIGWQAAGITPIRPNWSGLLPVPGEGRYEWRGFLPILDLPHLHNPPEGYIATANENNLPPGYRHAVGFEWTDPFRLARIAEVLGSGRKLTMTDMMRLQQDELSIPARTLVPLLRTLRSGDPRMQQALEMLGSWDYLLDRGSVPAAIYVAWERRLVENTYQRMLPPEAADLFTARSLRRTIGWLTAPDGRFGADPLAGRDSLLLRSLEEALAELRTRAGDDPRQWQYGQERLKHAHIRHPLSELVDAAARARLDVGPHPRGGYSQTVNATGGGYNQPAGASFRIITETGEWDSALGTNTPGQSGDPESPHYTDLFTLWAEGRYFPVLFSRSKVEAAAEGATVLVPAPARAAVLPTRATGERPGRRRAGRRAGS